MKSHILIPRELLLIEIERRCPECNARVRIGLTKEDARSYRGFECERCKRTWDDVLIERDVPEWWKELRTTDLDSMREAPSADPEDRSEVVTRTSDSLRRTHDKAATEVDSF